MYFRQKILYVLLIIITFGTILIYWKKKKVAEKNTLSIAKKINIPTEKLILLLGGKDNIKSVENSHTKVKIYYLNRAKIDIEKIKNLKYVSGIFINDKSIDLLVGNQASLLKEQLEQ